jgi:tellurite resistance protein TerC
VLGALIMRAIFIAAGVTLLNRFHWIIYVFGAILIYSGIKLLRQHGAEIHPESNPLLRLFRKFFRVTKDYEGGNFFVRRGAMTYATPLALVLIVVETTDLLFAVDSIPAVLAVTREPFIVYTSNVFAIMGLRSLYFALAGMIETFQFLHYGLSLILILIGVKMLASYYIEIPIGVALGAVVGVLLISIVASLMFPKKKSAAT